MNSSETEIGLAKEAVWGEAPSPLVFKAIRVSGESLKIERNNVTSNEIRPDGNVSDLVQVGGGASGGISGELSADTFDEIIESVLRSEWDNTSPSTNKIVNGVKETSFTIQKKQSEDTTSLYELLYGMVCNSFSLSFTAEEIVTMSADFIGKGGEEKSTASGSTTDATTTPVLDASSSFVIESMFTSPIPELMSMNININRNLAAKPVAGSKEKIGVRAGRCVVTGDASVYFKSQAIMQSFLDGTAGEIAVVIGNTNGKKYRITLPNVKIQDSDHFSPGNDEDVMLNFTWQALYDDTIEGTIEMERYVTTA